MLVRSRLIFFVLFLGGADTWERFSFRFRGESLKVNVELSQPLKYNVGTVHISEEDPEVKWLKFSYHCDFKISIST